MDHDKIQDYNQIIAKTVYDFIRTYSLGNKFNADDMIQSCWVKILEYQKRYNKLPDYKLAKVMSKNAVKDYFDYELRRVHKNSSIDDFVEEPDWNNSSDIESDVEISELANMFPKGSKERIYIDFYLSKIGASQDYIPASGKKDSGYTEDNLAHELGYASSASGGYRKFRAKMKELIADYYGR